MVVYLDPNQNPVATAFTGAIPTITEPYPGTTTPVNTNVPAIVLTKVTQHGATVLQTVVNPYTNISLAFSAITPTSSESATTSPTSSSTNRRTSTSQPPGPSSTGGTASSNAGYIAGAAVGCFIGGALIAGLLVWFLMSSRHKKRKSRGGFAEHRPNSRNITQEKFLPTAPLLGEGVTGGWEQHLPQSESDGTMRSSVKALFDQIELHVENFYRNAAVSISPEMQRELMKVDSSYLPDSAVGLLSQTRTPTMLIKHCLAHLIISRITADSDAPTSFLPADFVALPRAMSSTRTNKDKPGEQHAK